MNASVLVACLVCFSTLAHASDVGKTIVVDKTKFSDVYPAVWFSPSTGEIAPLKERSEVPPAKKYEIWIEPGDPEFGYNLSRKRKDVGFALLGKGLEVFRNPLIPPEPRLKLKMTKLMKESQGSDGLVFYCKAKTSECLLMITAMDSEKGVMSFKWRLLPTGRLKIPNTAKGISEAVDIAWLERIAGSLAEAQKLKPRGGLARNAKDLRTAAYARLGALGTKESLAAVRRVETKAKGGTLTPDTVSIDRWTHPSWHFGDMRVRPLAQTQAPNGKTYAVIRSALLGGLDLFLISSETPEDKRSWSRPRLIPGKRYRSIRKPSLRVRDKDVLVFSFVQEKPAPRRIMEGTPQPGKQASSLGPQELEIAISAVDRDQDGDGWTDVEEQRLGLNPGREDTDGDGISDGMDPCPNFAPPAAHETSEEIQILQKALFATFGLSDSRYVLIVGPKSVKAQVWGYPGPIIYLDNPDNWRKEHGYGAVFVDWKVSLEGDEARVSIGDYEGPEAAGSQLVRLKKIGGTWVVTKRELGPVS